MLILLTNSYPPGSVGDRVTCAVTIAEKYDATLAAAPTYSASVSIPTPYNAAFRIES